jgi:hypothetical protein
MGYLTNSYYITFLICEYGNLFRQPIMWVVNNISVKKYIYLLHHENKYNYYILINMLMGYYCMFALLNATYPLITLWFLVFGYFSNYTPLHMFILGLILYLLINVYYIKNAPKPKVPLLCVNNYNTVVYEKIVQKPICIVDNYNLQPKLPQKMEQPTLTPLKNIIILKTLYNPNYTILPI